MSERRSMSVVEKAARIAAPLVILLGAAACSKSESSAPASEEYSWTFKVDCKKDETPTVGYVDTFDKPGPVAVRFACDDGDQYLSNALHIAYQPETKPGGDNTVTLVSSYDHKLPEITPANVKRIIRIDTNPKADIHVELPHSQLVSYQVEDNKPVTQIAVGQ